MKGESHVPLTPAVGDGDYASGDAASPRSRQQQQQLKRTRRIHYGLAAFVLVNLVVLYILHFADRPGSSDKADTSNAVAAAFRSTGVSKRSAAAEKGRVVSFDADGQLRVGAGTTAYLDAAALPADAKSVAAFRFAPLGAAKTEYNANILSYQTGAGKDTQTAVTTFDGDLQTKKITVHAVDDKNVIKGGAVKGLVTLSDSTAAVLYSTAAFTPYVVPATIADGKISLHQDAQAQMANSSVTNFITRLSETEFGAVFYEPYVDGGSWNQRATVGSIKDGKVTFAESVIFGTINSGNSSTTVGQPHAILNTSDRFTVPWFVEDRSKPEEGALCLSTFTFAAKTKNLTAAKPVCNTDYKPAYFVDAAKLSESRLALIFVDRAHKFALTVVVVEFSPISGKPKFRGAYIFDDATGEFDFGAAFGFYPKPTVRVLTNNRLAVGFLNPSADGKPSIKILKYSSDASITALSPVLPLSNADFSVASADPDAMGGFVMDMIPLETGVVVGYAGTFGGAQHQRVAFVEAFGRPVGIVSDLDGSELNVAMSGTVDVKAKLTPGRAYYAATDGQLYSPSTNTNDNFVLANDDKVVISKDALLGVAVSDKTLFVAAQAN